jgi:hypothetical protein
MGTVHDHSGSENGGWAPALVRAVALLAVAFVGFVIVPDRLIAFLATRLVPRDRDFWVTLYVIAFFIAASWLFVRLQRGRAQ